MKSYKVKFIIRTGLGAHEFEYKVVGALEYYSGGQELSLTDAITYQIRKFHGDNGVWITNKKFIPWDAMQEITWEEATPTIPDR